MSDNGLAYRVWANLFSTVQEHNMAAGDKKYGRNKIDSARYKMLGTLDRNKRRRVAKHLNEHPKDTTQIGTVPDYSPRR